MTSDQPSLARARRYPVRALAVALFIAVIGPLLGFPPLIAIELDLIARYGFRGLGVLVYAYEAGGAQAMLTGLWLGYRTYRLGSFTYREAALTALAASALFSAWVVAGLPWPYTRIGIYSMESALQFGAMSVWAAVLCRFLLGRFGVVPSNGFFRVR